jgi:phosphoglucomutase
MAGDCGRRVYGGQYPAGGGGNCRLREDQPEPHRVLVGRDPRFLGESFVAEAARVLAGAGVTPIVIPEAAPTPAIAYAVRTLKTSGAINFTASHNPPEYNGIKYSTPDGAPALPEVTKQIEAAIAEFGGGGGAAFPARSRRTNSKPPT